MRYSNYLTELPADAQQAVANDLTIGAAWAARAARGHTANPRAARELGMIALAYASLRAALEGLGEHGGPVTGPTAAPVDHEVPASWTDLVAQVGAETVGTWLQMAAEMARDAAAAARQDADVAIVRERLRDALDTLTSVRNDALSNDAFSAILTEHPPGTHPRVAPPHRTANGAGPPHPDCG